VLVDAESARVLVDAAVDPRAVARRLPNVGLELSSRGVDAIVSHHHGDQVGRLEAPARALRCPVYLHRGARRRRCACRRPRTSFSRSGDRGGAVVARRARVESDDNPTRPPPLALGSPTAPLKFAKTDPFRRVRRKPVLVRTLVRIGLGSIVFALAACSSPAPPPPTSSDYTSPGQGEALAVSDDPCGDQAVRCACPEAGRTTSCGVVTEYVGSYRLCTYGIRTCDPVTLTWTPCEGSVAGAFAPDGG
jgi:hypothetical protein